MREELRPETPTDPGLTTADFARLDDSTSRKIDNPDRESKRDLSAKQNLESNRVDSRALRTDGRAIEEEHDPDDPTARANEIQANTEFNPPRLDDSAPLFSTDEADQLHKRWEAVQVSFVDEPRSAVQQADGLVASAMKRLAEIFAEERTHLDSQWDRGGDVSTEDLRIALQRYRSFFGRILSV